MRGRLCNNENMMIFRDKAFDWRVARVGDQWTRATHQERMARHRWFQRRCALSAGSE